MSTDPTEQVRKHLKAAEAAVYANIGPSPILVEIRAALEAIDALGLTELVAGYVECIEDMQGWAAYAGDYFQEKWDLAGDVARHKALVGPWVEGER